MAINNPYIPGDPYSYDLKWIVAKVKEILLQLGTLDEQIEKKIFEGFVEHSIVQFHNVAEMLAADIKDGSIVLTLGYYEAGDQGALFYLIKDFNPGQCSLDYFLTMDNNAQIAIPVVVTPYVTPEMFGAKGDGTTLDLDALKKAFTFGTVVLTEGKTYLSDVSEPITAEGSFNMEGNNAELKQFELYMENSENITIKNVVISDGGHSLNFTNCRNVIVEGVKQSGSIGTPRFVELRGCENVKILNCEAKEDQYGVFMREYPDHTTKNVLVDGCSFKNTVVYDYPAAVDIGDAEDVVISNCIMEGFVSTSNSGADGYGVYQGDEVYFKPSNINVHDNKIASCGRGMRIHAGDNVVISNNIVLYSVDYAIQYMGYSEIDSTYRHKGLVISGNSCDSVIAVGGGVDGAVIEGNSICKSDQKTPDEGVYVSDSQGLRPNGVLIKGNKTDHTGRSGIQVRHCDNPVVEGNFCVDGNLDNFPSNDDYRSAGVNFDYASNPVAIGNVIRNGDDGLFQHAIKFQGSHVTGRRIYLNNVADGMKDTNINGGYNSNPASGKWMRGEQVFYMNPTGQNWIGTVCTVSGDYDGTPPTWRQFGALQ